MREAYCNGYMIYTSIRISLDFYRKKGVFCKGYPSFISAISIQLGRTRGSQRMDADIPVRFGLSAGASWGISIESGLCKEALV